MNSDRDQPSILGRHLAPLYWYWPAAALGVVLCLLVGTSVWAFPFVAAAFSLLAEVVWRRTH